MRGDKKQTASAFKAFAMSMEEFEFEFEVIVQRDKQGGRCGGVDERGTVRVAYNDFVSGKASGSRESVAAASLSARMNRSPTSAQHCSGRPVTS